MIGSHIVDAALAAGWDVRILDNLQRQTHRDGKPPWVPDAAEFMQGDVRDRQTWERALDGVDVVFHEAAYGGYMPEIAKFIDTNGVGTALMLETIRDRNLPVRKVVVASSQAVYNEGAYTLPGARALLRHHPSYRPARARRLGRPLPHLRRWPRLRRRPTRRPRPAARMSTPSPRSIQERLVISWGRATGIPVVALRYSCTYGPRQSLFNPYTGVIAIFCTRLANDLPPVVYEDGRQSRDLIFVEDVARANLLVASDPRADGQVFNVGTGQAPRSAIWRDCWQIASGKPIAPLMPGEFRPGEMRALISDASRLGALGFVATDDAWRRASIATSTGCGRKGRSGNTSPPPSVSYVAAASSNTRWRGELDSRRTCRRWASSSRR